MIIKLTKDQESKIPVYLNKWVSAGLRTETTDRTTATEAVYFLYEKIMGIEKPKYVIFLDSPMACQLAANLIKNTKFDSSQLGSQLCSQLYSQLHSQIDSQLGSQLYSQLYVQLYSQLYVQLGSQLYSQLYSQLDSQLGSQLYSQLGSQLHSQLYSQLYSQLHSQLDSQLGSQLYSQLYSQLGSQLRSQELEYFYYSPNLWWWPGWCGFYNYLLNEVFQDRKKDFSLFEELLTHWKEAHYYLIFPEIAFVSDFPKEIHRNTKNDLHANGRPALEYRDSYGLFRLNGVEVPEWAALNKPEDLVAKDVIAIKNTDSRREVMKKVGISRLFQDLEAKKLNAKDEYELYRVKLGEDFEGTYLKMINPSTGEIHVEGIPDEIKTCSEALAWRIGLKLYREPVIKT